MTRMVCWTQLRRKQSKHGCADQSLAHLSQHFTWCVRCLATALAGGGRERRTPHTLTFSLMYRMHLPQLTVEWRQIGQDSALRRMTHPNYNVLYEQDGPSVIIVVRSKFILVMVRALLVSQVRRHLFVTPPAWCVNHGPNSVGVDMKAMVGGWPTLQRQFRSYTVFRFWE